jgi:hypothetical protein
VTDFARTHFVDKVSRVVVIILSISAIWGGIRWMTVQGMRAELAGTIQDIANLQTQAERIIRLQSVVDSQQNLVTERIDERLDRIETNTETIKAVVVNLNQSN